jgi:hypothetical protein
MSGAKESRPGLQALMADARRGMFGVVVVWRFDRFARSVKQLVMALEEFRTLGIEFISHQEALDTSTPMGKAMFTIIAAMAELERSVIRERGGSGLRPRTRNEIWTFDWSSQENIRPRGSCQTAAARHERQSDRTAARDWIGNGRAGLEGLRRPNWPIPPPPIRGSVLVMPKASSADLEQQPCRGQGAKFQIRVFQALTIRNRGASEKHFRGVSSRLIYCIRQTTAPTMSLRA